MLAAKRGHAHAAEALVAPTLESRAEASALELCTVAGLTALSLACVEGHAAVAAALLAAGADAATADDGDWSEHIRNPHHNLFPGRL